jgi:hypothetical protein
MTNCAPIRITQAVADTINAAVLAGVTFDRSFQARLSFGEIITKLEDVNVSDGLLVDVLPATKPVWELRAQGSYKHEVRVKVGLRRRLDPADRDADGDILFSEIATYCNLLYQVINLFANGRSLSDFAQASWNPRQQPDVQLYDEAQLKQGLYLGWVHLPFLSHEAA